MPGGQVLMGLSLPDTGTNACYMEEARHVAVLDEDRGRVCISIEWGSFSDEGALGPVQTIFDHTLDHESLNPGAQRWPNLLSRSYNCFAPLPLCCSCTLVFRPTPPVPHLHPRGPWPVSTKEWLKVLQCRVFNSYS